jgi:tRNA nucleotidyltransferase (CCA-adding enzyme)
MQSFKMDLPDEVRIAIDSLERHGYEAYVVGGCVRDSLMGRTPHDWDITTNATPDMIQEVFRGYRQALDGLKHGTVTIIIDRKPVEITTYRIDGKYSDGRRPDRITFTSDLTEDLARRDFTINACAYGRGGLIDPFSGAHDITDRSVRAVGDPVARFEEDALRILRAMRFASELSFSVESQTKKAMHECKHMLAKISQERITDELSKLLLGNNVGNVLEEFRDILLFIIPELQPLASASGHSRNRSDPLGLSIRAIALAELNLPLRIALLLRGIDRFRSSDCSSEKNGDILPLNSSGPAQTSDVPSKVTETVLRRMRFPNQIIKQVTIITHYTDRIIDPDPIAVKRVLRKTGTGAFRLIIDAKRSVALSKSISKVNSKTQKSMRPCGGISHHEYDLLENILDNIIEQNECFSLSDLAVSGKDLGEIGVPEGKIIGETLNSLLDLVIGGKVENKKDALLAEARKLIKYYP